MAHKLEQLDQGTGNTKTVPKKQVTQSKQWCFTFNNYSEKDYKDTISKFRAINCKFIVGKEVGAGGTPHLQGYIYQDTKFRPSELDLSKKIHWEKCRGKQKENIVYCSKDGKYEYSGLIIPRPLKILKEEQLYRWQIEIEDIVKTEPDDRTIYWYWEPNGKVGKSTFAKRLAHIYGAVQVEGKKNDILYVASEYESECYIFDFERSMEDYISYGAMEKIKNGHYMCAKYEGKPILRNSPHIICFANFAPDTKQLSQDRWVIKRIPS